MELLTSCVGEQRRMKTLLRLSATVAIAFIHAYYPRKHGFGFRTSAALDQILGTLGEEEEEDGRGESREDAEEDEQTPTGQIAEEDKHVERLLRDEKPRQTR